ncbi:MAG: DNA-binding response regulator [Sphaerobacteraceae bacterium]|nr:MAG: DNA-binding response regulator [Sphaerobacteraceae bacterium]
MARILVVDDDSSIATMLIDFLTVSGFQAASEPDGLRALQHVDLRQPDLVLLDLMLPVVTGVEVAKRLRQDPSSRHIPILAITALDQPDEFADILMVDSIIRKPIDLEHLGQRITELLRTTDDSPGPPWIIANAF